MLCGKWGMLILDMWIGNSCIKGQRPLFIFTFQVRFAEHLEEREWDMTDSMSFYVKTQTDDELKMVTKLFDPERDYQMTFFCSNLIHHLVYFRRVSMKFDKDIKKDHTFKIKTFGKEPIDKCNKVNVQIQDLVYSIKRTKK